MADLNEISSHFLDANGKQLVFAVKKGTDSTALWKGTVRVACVKVSRNSMLEMLWTHVCRLMLNPKVLIPTVYLL